MTIRNKLVLYTIGTIIITLIMTGMAINIILTDLYNNNARTELNYSYLHFKNKLTTINSDIINQSTQISTDRLVIATTNLIQRFQNKNNYQPLIFNNEKKKIANYLQKQIALSKSDRAMIYAKDGSLIAYAIQDRTSKAAGITSYEDKRPVYISNINQTNNWTTGHLPDSIPATISPLKDQISLLSYTGKIIYVSGKNKFIVKKSRAIIRNLPNGRVELLGALQISKSFDTTFFKTATEKPGIQISLLLEDGSILNNREELFPIDNMKSISLLHGDTYTATESILTNKKYYIQSYVWPTTQGNNYLLISLSRSDLISALNQTRVYLLIIFSIIAILIILTGIYWLNRLISTPLNTLVKHAKFSKDNIYPNFPVSKGNDEISHLGIVLNKMVTIIEAREKDLTARTEKLNNAQHLAKIGDWELDLISDSMQWSDEAYSLFGYTPENCIPSREAIISVMHPDDVEKSQREFDRSIIKHQPFDIIHRILTEENHTKFIHVYGEHQYSESGTPLRSVGTMQDITEQVSKDEQIRRTQKMDALGKLTGGIAHDFNNMLGIIMGFTELLQGSLSTENKKQDSYIHEILQATDRARKLTSKLLSFSRKDTATASKTNINKFLLDEQHMLEKTLTVRIQLKLELEDNLWPVWLDKDELEDAIINMSINAMHAIAAEGELTLSTQNINLSQIDIQNLDINTGDYVLLSITDSGIGMNSETLQHIFEPFFTTKKDKGTGLGMSQVYGFIKRSKGTIHIYSEPGYGTRINIYLPRHLESVSTPLQLKNSEEDEDLSGSARILVVDDEPGLRTLTREILTSNGYSVLLAESGTRALEVLKEEQIDLILSDVIMPGMNGYELTEKVKELYPLIKIQMASGFSDIQNINIKDNDLYKNRLQKPYSAKILLRRVKELLS